MSSDFRRIVKNITIFSPKDEDLNGLSKSMTQLPYTADSKTITAGYTYLGQFIDHDISLDSEARTMPWEAIDLSKVFNQRTPAFDLETIYGVNPKTNQNAIPLADLLKTKSLLKLGKTVANNTVSKQFENDLPRHIPTNLSEKAKAKIADSRNDENLLVAQTQVAFMKFHNTIAQNLGGEDSTARFEEARRRTIRYYQHIVLEDFLPKIIKKEVLKEVKNGNYKFLPSEMQKPFMPSEFAVAAYRMGHSAVRDRYNLNLTKESEPLIQMFQFTGHVSLRTQLPSDWIINWNRFYAIKSSNDKPEFAKKIDTKLADPLGKIRTFGEVRARSLASLDLYRGRLFQLESGQEVAKALGITFLSADFIAELLPTQELKDVFSNETPLWFYLLAEAEKNEDGETLGETGSHIVAETFYRLLQKSEHSVLNESLSADEKKFVGVNEKDDFGMPQMLQFIEKNEPGFLNPVEA